MPRQDRERESSRTPTYCETIAPAPRDNPPPRRSHDNPPSRRPHDDPPPRRDHDHPPSRRDYDRPPSRRPHDDPPRSRAHDNPPSRRAPANAPSHLATEARNLARARHDSVLNSPNRRTDGRRPSTNHRDEGRSHHGSQGSRRGYESVVGRDDRRRSTGSRYHYRRDHDDRGSHHESPPSRQGREDYRSRHDPHPSSQGHDDHRSRCESRASRQGRDSLVRRSDRYSTSSRVDQSFHLSDRDLSIRYNPNLPAPNAFAPGFSAVNDVALLRDSPEAEIGDIIVTGPEDIPGILHTQIGLDCVRRITFIDHTALRRFLCKHEEPRGHGRWAI